MLMLKMRHLAVLSLLCAAPALGQTMNVGLKSVTMSSEPYIFETAEQRDVKVTLLLKFTKTPFKLLFMDNGDLLVAERGGGIRIVRGATSASPELDPTPIEGTPTKRETGEPFELLDIALHPRFAENNLIYFSGNYILPEGQRQAHFIVMSGKLANGRITDLKTLVKTDEASFAGGSRLQFGMDGKLYITTGAPFGDAAQRLDSIYGKILRINDDGSIPSDNPFVGQPGARGEIYTLGHRDQIGLTMRPGTGELLTTEHGPNGGDEVNLVRKGANYG